MSSKQQPPSSPSASSKLPKFLQKQSRDRSRSVNDSLGRSSPAPSVLSGPDPMMSTPAPGRAGTAGPVSSASMGGMAAAGSSSSKPQRKGSRFRRGGVETDVENFAAAIARPSPDADLSFDGPDEAPVIVEPASPLSASAPRPRTRQDFSSSPYYPTSASTSRLGDFPNRLSGWLSHTFSTSATDLSLPSIMSQHAGSPGSSPKGKGSAFLTAAKHGKASLNTAMRYILDTDSTPDRCTDPIWLLGVQHPGYEPPPPGSPPPSGGSSSGRRSSIDSRRSGPSLRSGSSRTSDTATQADPSLSQSQPASSSKNIHPSANWPPVFYADFTSRLWLTYRSQFIAIRDTDLSALEDYSSSAETASISLSPSSSKRWNWGIEKGWSSDSGWGCMVRTGQSLLANALIHLHLGRDWRRPPHPVATADYAAYVHIISWFLDNPTPLCPFSVHRMVLVGKKLQTPVGQWFGPSIAAGAIMDLVNSFPESGMGVVLTMNQMLHTTDVFEASNSPTGSPGRHRRSGWGNRAVLILVTTRLGLDGVNPIYYDTLKMLFTFPQSMGIAGGRPRSSYYFVGSQADSLFYLDPHHARPSVPFRPPPVNEPLPHPFPPHLSRSGSGYDERQGTPDSSDPEYPYARGSSSGNYSPRTSPPLNFSASRRQHTRSPTSPSSTHTGSSAFSYQVPAPTHPAPAPAPAPAPSPLHHQLSLSTSTTASGTSSRSSRFSASPPSAFSYQGGAPGPGSSSASASAHTGIPTGSSYPYVGEGEGLTPAQEHYVNAYPMAELRTFHCERVRKMPLSGLDPSMLIGFLIRDENDWIDFQRRWEELPRNSAIFAITDAPPADMDRDDVDLGMESLSEPDDMDMPSDSISSTSAHRKSSEVDTEEDPLDPVTPGPNSHSRNTSVEVDANADDDDDGVDINQATVRMSHATIKRKQFGDTILVEDDDDDDDGYDDSDWVDPSVATPLARAPPHVPPQPIVIPTTTYPSTKSSSTGGANGSGSVRSTKGKERKPAVPVPMVRTPSHPAPSSPQEYQYQQQQGSQHFPFPSSSRDEEGDEDDDLEIIPPPERPSRIGKRPMEQEPTASSRQGQGQKQQPRAPRGRDGGRTQSGGVRGVPYYDEP